MRNPSILAAGINSLEFEIKFKYINDKNLFNETDDISSSLDTNKDTCLVCIPLFQVVTRGYILLAPVWKVCLTPYLNM